MSAINTVSNVISWAIDAKTASVPAPPQGSLELIDELIKPPEKLVSELKHLVALTIAKLRLGNPPLGERGALSTESLLYALAIGLCSHPKVAEFLLRTVSPARNTLELVARHALLEPALPHLPDSLKDTFKENSLLTGVLNYPLSFQKNDALKLIDRFVAGPRERQAMLLRFAQPIPDLAIREWRLFVLRIFRTGDSDQKKFVLDVYEAQMIHYHKQTLDQIKQARNLILNPTFNDANKKTEEKLSDNKDNADKNKVVEKYSFQDDYQIRNALSVGEWWEPLYFLDRSSKDDLRSRRYLGYDYRKGIDLYNFCKKYKTLIDRGKKTNT